MSTMVKNDEWASETLKEAPYWRDGMTPEEYDEERVYFGENYELFRQGKYLPLWKQHQINN